MDSRKQIDMKQQNLFETEPAPWEADEAEDRTFATVVLSEAPYGPYDYLIPEGLRAGGTWKASPCSAGTGQPHGRGLLRENTRPGR